ncbi:MAG: chromate transporter [Proteobacteria bacterium]|nr:chromate transporter [Pseudomonadota bacterium]
MTDVAESGPTLVRPSLGELFMAFVAVALSGFGGALPWARRMIVERKRWMTAEEFNEDFALSQFLPGPNVVNFSVVFGARIAGAAGAAVAFVGLMGPPLLIVTVIAVLYAHYGDLEVLSHILSGISAAAAGLIIAMTIKMAKPLFARIGWPAAIAIVAFVGVAIVRWPLPLVLVVLAPIAFALAWFYPVGTVKR